MKAGMGKILELSFSFKSTLSILVLGIQRKSKLLIFSSTHRLLSAGYVPGSVLGAGKSAENRANMATVTTELTLYSGKET